MAHSRLIELGQQALAAAMTLGMRKFNAIFSAIGISLLAAAEAILKFLGLSTDANTKES